MILAGTGHRPTKLGGYSQAAQLKLYNLAVLALEELKPTKVISGMALGWDQALALAATNNDIPLIAAVPFKGQEKIWPQKSKDQFNHILLQAEDVVIVCEGGYAAHKMQIRNEWMVDHADEIVAVWDGSKGGTYNCVQYARLKGKPIHNYWDKF